MTHYQQLNAERVEQGLPPVYLWIDEEETDPDRAHLYAAYIDTEDADCPGQSSNYWDNAWGGYLTEVTHTQAQNIAYLLGLELRITNSDEW